MADLDITKFIHIITCCTMGAAEDLGEWCQEYLDTKGYNTKIYHGPAVNEVPYQGHWLIVTSTHGAGEFPDNIQPWIQSLIQQKPVLDKLSYQVIAIGDKSYDTFCGAGVQADQLLETCGATRLSSSLKIDMGSDLEPEEVCQAWITEHY